MTALLAEPLCEVCDHHQPTGDRTDECSAAYASLRPIASPSIPGG